MVWTSLAALGFFLDAADALDYPNFSEADYSLLIVSLGLSMTQVGLLSSSYKRIRNYHNRTRTLTAMTQLDRSKVRGSRSGTLNEPKRPSSAVSHNRSSSFPRLARNI